MNDPRISEIQRLLPTAMLADWVRLGSRLVRLLRDNHHPARHDAILERLLQEARDSIALREHRRNTAPYVSYPPDLPITASKDRIIAALRANQVIVVAGETGSGKTTQLPKMCLEAGLGIEASIGCTQPRRVAALSISARIAEELNCEWGREVGCKIRFDDRSRPETLIKLMTDGILLAEVQNDPLLSDYNAIIIDEAHERSLNIDFLLGHLRNLAAKRPELKIIITSATIDTQAFSEAFGRAPIIEVSGRMYPVDTIHAPCGTAFTDDEALAPSIALDTEEVHYIDAAVRATEQIACEPGSGDVLIFMPTERDIRETADALRPMLGDAAEIIPLFGRLSSSEQQRVFSPCSRRKIVVATNIAETSLTIPGIRYVIDTGLARISRYNPRNRTRRLPIEPISQSSANQRKGRAGRVREGVCIRLYSEADFYARPPYTQPEIQRSNLAEVILRMKASRLGEIETFPFLNPPTPNAIQGGYTLLIELGALDANRQLTQLGRDLARLPIDPALGRMLLQSQREHASRELLIIAAGLSIQDPRERPLDQQQAADAAHRQFADSRSDFLSLLKLWNYISEHWDALGTQNQRRKFCKSRFLSYLRIREWQDLYEQLRDALEDAGATHLNESNATYESIHRSILSGLLGHIARRTERNTYKGVGNRTLALFPGSAMFDRAPRPQKKHGPKQESKPTPKPASQPEWIVAGEIVETRMVYARSAAEINPEWVMELAPQLCVTRHENPLWSARSGQVLVTQITTFSGLELQKKKVAYSNVNPAEATEIFIRSALVDEALFPEDGDEEAVDEARPQPTRTDLRKAQLRVSPARPALQPVHSFLEHNHQLRHKINTWRTRSRNTGLPDLDEALFEYYAKRLQNVSSIHELNRWLRDNGGAKALCATPEDLIGERSLDWNAAAFPDAVSLGGQSVPVAYTYSPGEEHDGVTLKLPAGLARDLSPGPVEWAVPGLRESQVTELLRSLPKSLRRELMPFAPKVAEILRELEPTSASLQEELTRFIRTRYGINIPADAWAAADLPQHLRPRIEIVGGKSQSPLSGRDLDALKQKLAQVRTEPAPISNTWTKLTEQWERFGINSWSFIDLPERIPVPGNRDAFAWPGLQCDDGQINLRLFHTPDAAQQATARGLPALVEIAIQRDLAWLQKDLRSLVQFAPLINGWTTAEQLQTAAYAHLKNFLLRSPATPALTRASFDQALASAKERLPGLVAALSDRLKPIVNFRVEIARKLQSVSRPATTKPRTLSDFSQLGATAPAAAAPNPMLAELNRLLPSNFLEIYSFERLRDLPRYLKALAIRVERAALNPVKDREKAAQIEPYAAAYDELRVNKRQRAASLIEELRWMLEEFRVSLFAQELGTAFPVSPKRLDAQLTKIREA
jgi:ATP-dependent helicase HrpA